MTIQNALHNRRQQRLHPHGHLGGILNPLEGYKRPGDGVEKAYRDHKIEPDFERKIIKVQCFPLYSVLLALGNPTVDIFSLDIEGAELQVLRVREKPASNSSIRLTFILYSRRFRLTRWISRS